ncbi:MAG: mitochondrial small ribosomal subunit protein uS17m [Rickettsiales bacterium]|nr:mitochondrial small ribosomal subunit protein uS17m [Rickettsiales bacterium]
MIEAKIVKIIDTHTVKVLVVETKRHPLYNKVLKKRKYYMCHVNELQVAVDSMVMVENSRPYSKMKKHVVVEVIK